MGSAEERLTRTRAVQCIAVASAAVLLCCADPALGPRLGDVGKPVLTIQLAAKWTPKVVALPNGATESAATDVNDSGVVVGAVVISGLPGTHAVRWTNGVPTYLQEPIGPSSSTRVAGVNNSGIAVGDWNPGVGENKAVWWDAAGVVSVLTGLTGGGADWATDVSDVGVIVGQSQSRAVRWVNTVVQDLHPTAYAKSRATGINAAGDIAGWWSTRSPACGGRTCGTRVDRSRNSVCYPASSTAKRRD